MKERMTITADEFQVIATAANKGDAQALCQLRELLDHCPEICQRAADLNAHALGALINTIASGQAWVAESLRRKLAEMSEQLQQPDDRLLQKLAVERVLVAWLFVELADRRCLEEGAGTPLAKYWLQRQRQASVLYDAAVRSLATLRRLRADLPAAGSSNATVQLARGTVEAIEPVRRTGT